MTLLQADGKSLRQQRAHVNIGNNKNFIGNNRCKEDWISLKIYDQIGNATVKKII